MGLRSLLRRTCEAKGGAEVGFQGLSSFGPSTDQHLKPYSKEIPWCRFVFYYFKHDVRTFCGQPRPKSTISKVSTACVCQRRATCPHYTDSWAGLRSRSRTRQIQYFSLNATSEIHRHYTHIYISPSSFPRSIGSRIQSRDPHIWYL